MNVGPRLRATVVAALATATATTALHTVLSGRRWIWPVLAAIAVVAAVGALARKLHLPVLFHPLLCGLALLLLVAAVFAPRHGFAGVIPTPSSLRDLRHLVAFGIGDIRTVAAPAYPSNDLVLLAVLGTGLVALSVDLLAVSGERPPLAGLALVLMIAVPAAIRGTSVGTLPFLATATGFLALLTLDSTERAARWGRRLAGLPHGSIAAESGGVGPGWRIGALALISALVIPVAIPGARTNRFTNGFGRTGHQGSSATVIDPFVQIAAELTNETNVPLLTVATDMPSYLRLTALENLSDSGFSLEKLSAFPKDRVSHGIAAPDTGSELIATQPVHAVIKATARLADQILPVPQNTITVKVNGDWRFSGPTRTIFSTNTNTRGKTWTVTSAVPAPTAQVLAEAGTLAVPSVPYAPALAVDLVIPADVQAAVGPTALRWTAGATSAYAAVVDIQHHFTDGSFVYTTTVPYDPGAAGYRQFLAQRHGFCEQYAATMTAMVRSLGLPARVAIGFTTGQERADGSYLITGEDAHAWPEVWFPTAGWVRFEPTPLTSGHGLIPPYAAAGAAGGTVAPPPGQQQQSKPGAAASSNRSGIEAKLDHEPGSAGAASAVSLRARRLRRQLSFVLGLLVLAMFGGAAPAVVTALVRRRRYRSAPAGSSALAEALWAQLLDDAADRGVLNRPAASPRATGRRIAAHCQRGDTDPMAAALTRLVHAVELSRYGPREYRESGNRGTPPLAVDPAQAVALCSDVTAVRRALSASLPWRRRVSARLAPITARRRLLEPLRSAATTALVTINTAIGKVIGAYRVLIGRRLGTT